MAAPIPLRSDFDAAALRQLARRSRDASQARRLVALAAIYDGAARGDAARLAGVTLQIARDWVVRFNAEGPDELLDRKAAGPTPKLDDAQRRALAARVEAGPIPAVHGVVRWRLVDLAQWVWEEFRLAVSVQTLSRELRAGVSQAVGAAAPSCAGPREPRGVQKNFPAALAQIAANEAAGKPIEIWFADEMRVGQKNSITRRWAKRGTRPSAPKDQRTASAYLFDAICPKLGKGAALVLPRCDTAAMNLDLREVAAAVAPGAHAVLLLDQAGWHMSAKLVVPPNITLMPLPPKAPELYPVENLWQFIRDNGLSNRIFRSYDAILDHACAAWRPIVDQPWRIMTLGLREWAHGS